MYWIAPFAGWLVAGVTKFIVNQLRYGNARERIGYGGFPSNHTTIVTTTAALIGFREGFGSPLFGLAAAVCFIVIIDAAGLRRHVGRQAVRINELAPEREKLRESIGHHRVEILGGLALGTLLGWVLSLLPF